MPGKFRKRRSERTSQLLRRTLSELPDPHVSLGYLVSQLRRRSFGGILILLAAISLIPGVSVFSGLIIIVVGVQLIAGFSAPRFPRFLANKNFSSDMVRKTGAKVIPAIERLEKYVKPRLVFVTAPPILNLLGFVVIALSLVIMLPLPFSNMPPALALMAISVAFLERDGLVMLLGLVVAVVALAIGVSIASVAAEGIGLLLDAGQ